MGTIRMIAAAAMLAALAASPAAEAKAPLDLLAAAKQPAPETAKPATRKAHKPAASKRHIKRAVHRRAPIQTVGRGGAPTPAAPEETDSNVMRGSDTAGLIARLPWYRNESMQTIQYGTAAAESKVMAATDAWLVQHGSSLSEMTGDDTAMARADDEFDVASANEVNEIDLAAAEPSQSEPSSPPERSFLQSLIAVLGGALAAAASARYLFA